MKRKTETGIRTRETRQEIPLSHGVRTAVRRTATPGKMHKNYARDLTGRPLKSAMQEMANQSANLMHRLNSGERPNRPRVGIITDEE